jgi:hypothetical protein
LQRGSIRCLFLLYAVSSALPNSIPFPVPRTFAARWATPGKAETRVRHSAESTQGARCGRDKANAEASRIESLLIDAPLAAVGNTRRVGIRQTPHDERIQNPQDRGVAAPRTRTRTLFTSSIGPAVGGQQ